MGRITIELVRKRAEHNEGEISTLEELTLHQENIIRIENLDKWCRNLKVLLLQNNSISKLENLSRLKCLEYLNLAMNNIEVIEGLEGCESLQKLDLTLNFIGQISSLAKLRTNEALHQLYITGNPCVEFSGYRNYVLSNVPQLMALDGQEVGQSERILARQSLPEILQTLQDFESSHFLKREAEKTIELLDINDENFWNIPSPDTPEVRSQIQKKLEDEEAKKRGDDKPKKPPKLSKLFDNNGRPFNINEGKYKFSVEDDEEQERIVIEIKIPKYMDTSLVDIDVQPTYVRAIIKKKIFQLVLPEEVKLEESWTQRSQITGYLVISMPKLTQSEIIGSKIKKLEKLSNLMTMSSNSMKPKEREFQIEKNGRNSYGQKRETTGTYLTQVDNSVEDSEVPPLI